MSRFKKRNNNDREILDVDGEEQEEDTTSTFDSVNEQDTSTAADATPPVTMKRRVKNENTERLDALVQQFMNEHNTSKKKVEDIEQSHPWVVYLKKKLEMLFWIGSSLYLGHYIDFINVILYSSEINRVYFYISIAALLSFFSIYIYITYISKKGGGKPENWDKSHPKAVPYATICLVIFTFGFIIGCWNKWGFFTPGILFVFLIGLSYLV
ncbi:putative transmembrane protein [Cavenderia fasciculata]|uniref:Transmembrane protein n=1 Tax=Cavenderia fasciculata TaxID=261658 RepID=F4Q4M1_CACFS|nr:putative transmembrane protein [Cavenderia fasciculata]EGG17030.1 putative transmembrane protein [Cavenderia fasciculata]|eukprot:XP_004355514.1 putative transmembrane protein [Cavenderia fasciculata]